MKKLNFSMLLVLLFGLGSISISLSQTFYESMGDLSNAPSANNNAISFWEQQNRFDNDDLTMTGSVSNNSSIRSNGDSQGSLSAGNHVFLSRNGGFFTIGGINTLNMADLQLSFYVRRGSSNVAFPTSTFKVEVSEDGQLWTQLATPHSASTGWQSVFAVGTIPACQNLRIRFSQSTAYAPGSATNNYFYRLDDIRLSCDPVVLSSISTDVSCFGGDNGSIDLSATGSEPISYLWSNGIQTQDISGLSAGTYTVTASNMCSSASLTIEVSEPPVLIVNAGDDETVFYGYGPMECAELNAFGSGGTPGYSYSWTSNVSGGAVGSDVTVCPETNEVYVVTVVDANGCSASDELSICVINVECEAGNSGNMKVEMCQIPPGNPNNAHTICIDASAVPAHLAIGCTLGACGELENCNNPSGMTVQGNELKGLELSTEIALTAYPNPTRTATTISLTSVAKGDFRVVMTDMTGRIIETIYNGFMSDYENMTFDVDMSSLTSGIYLVNVLGSSGILNNLKLVKE